MPRSLTGNGIPLPAYLKDAAGRKLWPGGNELKQERSFPQLTVSKKAELSLRRGHPWVYGEELRNDVPVSFPNGGLVDVVSEKGRYLGTGFYSEKSKIKVRVLSDNANERFDDCFWQRRVKYAVNYRRKVMGNDIDDCRMIFGEADGFPGLTVDRYGPYMVSEVLSYGMDRVKQTVYRALLEEFPGTKGIYERGESAIRLLEGLPQHSGWAEGIPNDGNTRCEITENGIKYIVDFALGQKTGFFLDQKFNRRAVAALSEGMRVLDLCTHTGSFALNAVSGGAKSVTAVDVSQAALDIARENAAINGMDGKVRFVCADVFDYLQEAEKLSAADRSDLIILDPPAFTKSSRTLGNAKNGYREINYRAMRALPRGGYLATCSCSHFMTTELFLETLRASALDAGVALKIVEIRHQAPDHPVLLNVPETDYLKFVICQVI